MLYQAVTETTVWKAVGSTKYRVQQPTDLEAFQQTKLSLLTRPMS